MELAVKHILLALLLFSSGVARASAWRADSGQVERGQGETNAARFAQGLTPLPPRKRYAVTRTGPPKYRRSTYPASPETNTIKVIPTEATSPAPVCYLSFGGCGAQSSALPFTAVEGQDWPIPADLDVESGAYSGYDLIAVSTTASISSGDILSIELADNAHTDPTAGPSPVGSSDYYESAIWYVNPSNDVLGEWTNPDGSIVHLTFFIVSSGNGQYNTYAATDAATVTNNGGTPVYWAFT